MQAPSPQVTVSPAPRRISEGRVSPSDPNAYLRLPAAPATFAALRTLDLCCSCNAAPLWHGLLTCAPHLTFLNLSGNDLRADLRAARSTADSAPNITESPLLAALGRLPLLRRVGLLWNGIDDEGALCVLRVLRSARELEVVDLRCNSVVDLPAQSTLGEICERQREGGCSPRRLPGAAPAGTPSQGAVPRWGATVSGDPLGAWRATRRGPEDALVLAGLPMLEDIECCVVECQAA